MSDPVFRDPPRTGRGNPGVSRPGRVSRPTARQPNRGLTDDSPEFTCTVCREVKPMAEAHTVGAGGGKRRRTGWCSECGPKKVRENADNWIAKKRGPDYVLPKIKDRESPVVDGRRVCLECLENKPVESFYPDKTVASGYQPVCRVCRRSERRAKWAALSPDQKQAAMDQIWLVRLQNHYKLTLEEYEQMLEAQDYVCLICKLPSDRRLCVDHDHACCPGDRSCGACVRSLLCHPCNLAVGFIERVGSVEPFESYLATHARVPTDTPWADPGHDVLGDIQSYMREVRG